MSVIVATILLTRVVAILNLERKENAMGAKDLTGMLIMLAVVIGGVLAANWISSKKAV